MHIAFLTPEYPHPKVKHAAGIGTSIKNLVEALVQQKVLVSVFIYGQKENFIFEENGVNFHLIADKKYRFGKWLFYRKYIQKYINQRILKDKIDLIEAPDWTGITAFMNFKIPLIIRFHGSDTYFCHLEKRPQKLKNRWFESLAVKKAKAYIAPTQFAGMLSAQLFGIDKEDVKIIHYGLNLDQFKNEHPLHFEKGLIVYIGTIIRKKGVFELPEIFKIVQEKFPDSKLVLIGSDASDVQTGASSTWELVQQNWDNKTLEKVTYLGKKPYFEVQDYIKKANVCIFPTYAETLGMVTIESMAMQKPVVNSNIGWAKELMEHGKSGFLIHPANHEDFATSIIDILADDALNESIGSEARKFVQSKFDTIKIVQENIAFYKKMI